MNQKIIIPRLANSSQAELNKLVDSINLSLKDLYGNIGTPASAPTVSSGTGQLEREVLVDKGPQTAITIDNLDGLAHGGYRFEFYIINSSAGTLNYRLFYNNDTTDNDYSETRIMAISAFSGETASDARFAKADATIIAGSKFAGNGMITVSPEGIIFSTLQIVYDTTYLSQVIHKTKAALASGNLTRIDIVASVANGIGVYSRFRLWRMN